MLAQVEQLNSTIISLFKFAMYLFIISVDLCQFIDSNLACCVIKNISEYIELTNFFAIRKCHSTPVMDNGDVEDCFHCRLIEAREGFSSICRLHLRSSDHSVKVTKIQCQN